MKRGIIWILEAATIEPRVAVGLIMAVMLALGVVGIATFMGVGALNGASLVGLLNVGFFFFVVTLGLSLPVFAIIAVPKLWIQVWNINEAGIDEYWAHPKIRLTVDPSLIWEFNDATRIVVCGDGVTFDKDARLQHRRVRSLYSWVDVHNAINKERATAHFSPTATNIWQRVNVGALIALAGIFAFWGLAIMSEAQRT